MWPTSPVSIDVPELDLALCLDVDLQLERLFKIFKRFPRILNIVKILEAVVAWVCLAGEGCYVRNRKTVLLGVNYFDEAFLDQEGKHVERDHLVGVGVHPIQDKLLLLADCLGLANFCFMVRTQILNGTQQLLSPLHVAGVRLRKSVEEQPESVESVLLHEALER